MTNIIEIKDTMLETNLFSAIDEKTLKSTGEQYLVAYFKSRRCNTTIFDMNDAQKVIAEIQEKVAPFQIGQGCSVIYYSDVHAARVIETPNEKTVIVQEDKATLLNGVNSGEKDALEFTPGGFVGHTSGRQRWNLEANPNGAKHTFTLRKNGEWVKKGQPMNDGLNLSKNHTHHYDYNF